MGINNTIPHAQIHQEIVGIDPGTNYGLYPFVPRTLKTTANATPTLFSGSVNSTLQSGHSWALSNSPSGNLNYTSDFIQGTQCIKLVSNGSGSSATVTLQRQTALNISAKMIRLWLKFDSASYSAINSAFVILGSGASAFASNVQCQIAGSNMTANAEYAKPGEWVAFTFNMASFITVNGSFDPTQVQDWRVSIKDLGSGNATILFGGIDFIPNDSTYPNGVVSLTFDDSYLGAYNIAVPYMQKYGYLGTFYTIFDVIGSNPSLYMSQAQVDQLHTLGHEIAPHSELVADHNISGGFPALTTLQQMTDIDTQRGWVHSKGYKGPGNFAYPQGLFDTNLLAIIKQRYAAARTTTFRRIETLPTPNPHRLTALTLAANVGLGITPNTSPGTVEWYLDQITSYGGWLIIFSHDFVASGATGTQTNQATWNTVLDYINTKGLPVRTVGDVLGV